MKLGRLLLSSSPLLSIKPNVSESQDLIPNLNFFLVVESVMSIYPFFHSENHLPLSPYRGVIWGSVWGGDVCEETCSVEKWIGGAYWGVKQWGRRLNYYIKVLLKSSYISSKASFLFVTHLENVLWQGSQPSGKLELHRAWCQPFLKVCHGS